MSKQGSTTAYDLALQAASQQLSRKVETQVELPSAWIQKHFYVPEPRSITNADELYDPGPIILTDNQSAIVNEALSRHPDGKLKYVTVIYSAPKKSGKSAMASAAALYMAKYNPHSFVYCLANDGKQADDRLYGPIAKCIELHQSLGGIFKGTTAHLTGVMLDNSTKIEPLPCDASGNAGAEPIASFWSEIWGFTTPSKRRLWTELTVPPTKWGRALRWVESYAGFIGESELLWQLYEAGMRKGERHPDFPDLPVYVNERAGIFCYWDEEPRMIWQLGAVGEAYYASEASVHTPMEFQRVHRNQWVSPVNAYVQAEHWYACQDTDLPPLEDKDTPCVVGIDAAVENDCSAAVLVTRHPMYPDTDIAIRECRIFTPKAGNSIILPVGDVLREWGKKYNIVCVAYDAYQMSSMVQNFQQGNVTISEKELSAATAGAETEAQRLQMIEEFLKRERTAVQRWYYKFSQHAERAVADKRLFDMIVHRQIHWNPELVNGIARQGELETLTKQIIQAGSSQLRGQLRIQKLAEQAKVDSVVALAMAVDRCMALQITNRELDKDHLVRQLMLDKITYAQFMQAMRNQHVRVTDNDNS